MILRGARESADADEAKSLTRCAGSFAASLRGTKEAKNLDTLRGIEGEAARGYFGALNLIVKPAL